MKELIRLILVSPPIRNLLSVMGKSLTGKKILNRLGRPSGVFQNFSEGWEAARKTGLPGHEDWGEISIHLELAKGLRISDYPVLYWLLRLSEKLVRVFDYGGNVGNLAYSYSEYLSPVRQAAWTVYDLPLVMAEGRKIAAERKNADLHFAEKPTEFQSGQILLISGAFHYWEGTVESFLQQFKEQPRHILINRSPVHDKQHSFIAVQRTRTCAFPCIVRNTEEMIQEFSRLGYDLVDHWKAPELTLRPPLFPDYMVPFYSGFYFAHREGTAATCEGEGARSPDC